MITEFKDLLSLVEIDNEVVAYTGCLFENGYWKSFHNGQYTVVVISPSSIELKHVDYPEQYLRVDDENMKSGYCKIDLF